MSAIEKVLPTVTQLAGTLKILAENPNGSAEGRGQARDNQQVVETFINAASQILGHVNANENASRMGPGSSSSTTGLEKGQ